MTQKVDSIILARWVAPVDAQEKVFDNYGVALTDGNIVALDTHKNLKQQYSANHYYELPDHLLIPGLINAHTHAAMNLLKGFADDLPLMTWLQQHIWPAESKMMSDKFVYQGTQLAIAEMLKSGTTCFNDMYFMPDMAAKAALESGIRANVGLTVIDFPTAWAKDANEYIQKGLAVFDNFKGEDALSFSFAPHAPYTVSDDTLKRLGTLSQELDLTLHMHVHETAHEVSESIKQFDCRPLTRLHNLGLLSPAFQAVHMTQVIDDDVTLLQQTGSHVMHCPESNMKLASGICPVGKLTSAAINLAMGTDGSASNNDLDMLGEMRSASLLAKVGSGDASSFSARQALNAATLGGAKALGIDNKCGSIEVGKQADLCAINLNHIATSPVFDAVATLVYSATRDQVSHVWTRGTLQLEDGDLTRINENDCFAMASHWHDHLLKELRD